MTTIYPIKHGSSSIDMNDVPDFFAGVSLIFKFPFTSDIAVRSIGWAMRPSEFQIELLALRSGTGLVNQGLIWAGVSYHNVVDDYNLNGEKAAEDNLVSYLVDNSMAIVGNDVDDKTWRCLVKTLIKIGLPSY